MPSRSRALGQAFFDLADLAEKYELLLALAAGTPGRTEERRRAMQQIARRFPASLREFDQLSAKQLRARAKTIFGLLAKMVDRAERMPAWMRWNQYELVWARAWAEVHGLLREQLAAVGALPLALRKDPRARKARVGEDGRRSRRVYEQVAERHGMTADALRRLLFPRGTSTPEGRP